MTRETIAKIVKASGVSAGELILIHFWGENADKTVADQFAAAVAALGASPVVLQQARSVNREIFAGAKESCFDERYFGLFSKFDAGLDVFACQPIVLGYELEDAQMDLYRRYISQLFEKLVTCRRFAQIRIPTAANAAESGLDPQEYIRRMDRAYDVDDAAVRAACEHAAAQFAGASRVAVRTGEGCVLQLELTGRTWLTDAGDGDLPCGALCRPAAGKPHRLRAGTRHEPECDRPVRIHAAGRENGGDISYCRRREYDVRRRKPGDGPCRLRRPRRSGGAGMTGKKTAEMDRWLEEKIRRCGRRSQTLRADDRADEAAFEKIRANVYDIFRTVLSVAEKLLARDTTGYWRVKPE